VPPDFEWISVYWLLTFILFFIILFIGLVKFPKKNIRQAEEIPNKKDYLELIKNKYVILYFIALVAYASCEQGIAVWMSKFFQDVHGFDPRTIGSSILAWYWILVSGGCIAGMLLLKFFDARKVLAILVISAMICFSMGIYEKAEISKIAFPMVGIFISVVWPIVLSLALNSFSDHHEVLTGFLYMASIGGALGPLIIGNLSDIIGLRLSINFIYIPLIYILSVSFWAKPLILNKTIKI
jgi:fucose permease